MMIEMKKMENAMRLMIVERVVVLFQLAECRAGQGRASLTKGSEYKISTLQCNTVGSSSELMMKRKQALWTVVSVPHIESSTNRILYITLGPFILAPAAFISSDSFFCLRVHERCHSMVSRVLKGEYKGGLGAVQSNSQ
jgi:hypothetical protein